MEKSQEITGALIVADLSGYTALTEAHGAYSSVKTISRYWELVNESLTGKSKLIEKVGDEVLIFSELTSEIIKTALNLKNLVHIEPNFLDVHIGIHYGSLLIHDNSYYGSTINLASRIASQAAGDQILCSQKVKEQAGITKELEFSQIGSFKFKNVRDPVIVYEINWEGKTFNKERDRVCHMKIDTRNPIVMINFENKKYYFCSHQCAKSFLENPNDYLK